MEAYDEWFYSELLNILKDKEKDVEGQQLELELPFEEPLEPIGDGQIGKNEERGVVIIELNP